MSEIIYALNAFSYNQSVYSFSQLQIFIPSKLLDSLKRGQRTCESDFGKN